MVSTCVRLTICVSIDGGDGSIYRLDAVNVVYRLDAVNGA